MTVSCRECRGRDMRVHEAKTAIARLARALYRTDNPTTLARLRAELAEEKRQLKRSETFRDEHAAVCGVLV